MARKIVADALQICVQAAVIGLLLLSLAGYAGRLNKYFELLSHFKIQYAIASFMCLALLVVFQRWPWVALAFVCFAINVAVIAPFYFGNSSFRAENRRLKIALANVNYLNRNYAAVIELVRQEAPDVLILQEVTPRMLSEIEILNREFPFSKSMSQEGDGNGIALFSHRPLEHAEIVFLGSDVRPCVFARIRVDDRRTVSLLTIHPEAPIRFGHFERRNRQLAAASEFVKSMPAPKIFTGDLNTTMWSPYFADLERQTGMRNARRGFGLLPTWPTFLPHIMRIPIDHCLVSSDIHVAGAGTRAVEGSDHLSLIVELEIL